MVVMSGYRFDLSLTLCRIWGDYDVKPSAQLRSVCGRVAPRKLVEKSTEESHELCNECWQDFIRYRRDTASLRDSPQG